MTRTTPGIETTKLKEEHPSSGCGKLYGTRVTLDMTLACGVLATGGEGFRLCTAGSQLWMQTRVK